MHACIYTSSSFIYICTHTPYGRRVCNWYKKKKKEFVIDKIEYGVLNISKLVDGKTITWFRGWACQGSITHACSSCSNACQRSIMHPCCTYGLAETPFIMSKRFLSFGAHITLKFWSPAGTYIFIHASYQLLLVLSFFFLFVFSKFTINELVVINMNVRSYIIPGYVINAYKKSNHSTIPFSSM